MNGRSTVDDMIGHGLPAKKTSVTALATRACTRLFVALIVSAGLLIGAAGTLAWDRAWLQLGLWIVTSITHIQGALEDRMLLKELPGHTAYAGKTPYRLVPGVS